MSVYRIEDIQKDVRINIDRNKTNEALIELNDFETLSIDELIKSHIADGVKAVYSNAPIELLETGKNLSGSIYWREDNSGRIILPEDFMRLLCFKMSDWERAVYSTISESMPEYAYQHSRYGGIKGNYQNPVVAIIKRPEGNVLEFYCSKSQSATMDECAYLPYPKIESGLIDISDKCYRSVIYMISGLTLLSLNEAQGEKQITMSKEILSIES